MKPRTNTKLESRENMAPELLRETLSQVAISPYKEILAYEYLYSLHGQTLKKISDATTKNDLLPSQAMQDQAGFFAPEVCEDIEKYINSKLDFIDVMIQRTPAWPNRLFDAERLAPLLYYQGDIGLFDSPSVSVVGSRAASQEGLDYAASLARGLALNQISVVSGLARGIDTAAMQSAINEGGYVIGIIGTPLYEYYPKENADLQRLVASKHLLVSQVPMYLYKHQSFNARKHYFLERNELMAAVSHATVIIEAAEKSGTRTQANACIHQKRPLFFTPNCAKSGCLWVNELLDKGQANILEDVEQILGAIQG